MYVCRSLQVVLFECERTWSHSQSLKAQNKSNAHHQHKRLSKASQKSQSLLNLCQSIKSRLSPAHLAQVSAYHLFLKGALPFEQGKHEEGLNTLSVLWQLLNAIGEAAESGKEEALGLEMMDEVEPMARFCAYQLGKDTSKGVAQLSAQIATSELCEKTLPGYDSLVKSLESSKGEKKEKVELSWRGENIPVRSAELVEVVIKVKRVVESLEKDSRVVQEKKKGKGVRLGQKSMSAYDKALAVLGEAEETTRKLVQDNKVSNERACQPLLN